MSKNKENEVGQDNSEAKKGFNIKDYLKAPSLEGGLVVGGVSHGVTAGTSLALTMSGFGGIKAIAASAVTGMVASVALSKKDNVVYEVESVVKGAGIVATANALPGVLPVHPVAAQIGACLASILLSYAADFGADKVSAKVKADMSVTSKIKGLFASKEEKKGSERQ